MHVKTSLLELEFGILSYWLNPTNHCGKTSVKNEESGVWHA